MSKKTIVVLDDEVDILELIEVNLRKNGFDSVVFEFVDPFWDYLDAQIPDLIVLDLMLNETDGFEICKYIRTHDKFKNIPIIMLTARGDEMDRIVGLEIGADDYVTKPFSPRELIARIKAVLKRSEKSEPTPDVVKITEGLEIDTNRFIVRVDGKVIDLTATEFRILKIMSEKIGWVYSREQLLDALWGKGKVVVTRTIDVHIKNLRDKLLRHSEIIQHVRGVGYKIEI
jgi:two-component system phosphate regulon response regulator PhoB/two-component system alkaline phosphatase synthesis response regulator PhoP